jgi:hypothetical protein
LIQEAVSKSTVAFLLSFRAEMVNRCKPTAEQRGGVLNAIAENASLNREVRRELVCASMILW